MEYTPDVNILREGDLIPFSPSEPVGNRVLVLAPHPDDETLGCGGSLRILSKAGSVIKVIFLTKGEKAVPDTDKEKYALIREKEAKIALKILGVTEYKFLGFPDRELYENIDGATEMISMIIKDFKPDTLYSPSMIELNPDHRATAVLAINIMKIFGIRVIFYELTTPIRPNILVNISSVFKTKKKAIKAYRSQLKIIDYLKLISSLNIYRTFTLNNKVMYAEAFWVLSKEAELNNIDEWLSFKDRYPIK